jgi:LysM repeat protein
MKKYITFLFTIFCFCIFNDAYSNLSADSVGTTVLNGDKYIIHEVTAGETLFALSRKYGVSVQEIKDANTESLTSLSVGQRVNIPFATEIIDPNVIYHVVKPSETLYSVSRQYDVTVEDLVLWNNLQDNSISIGQKLKVSTKSKNSDIGTHTQEKDVKGKTHTVTQSQTLYGISRMYDVTTEQLRSWNSLNSDDLYIGQVLVITDNIDNSSMLPAVNEETKVKAKNEIPKNSGKIENPSSTASVSSVAVDEEMNDGQPSEKITQKGFAEVIENTNETKKYLALHRTAPQGTIMQVRNEMNNQSVFVRIVGSIPPTGDNSKVILKISKKAYDRLGAVDARFPVELSYMP